MFGFVFGTLCLVGLVGTARFGRCHRGHHHGHHRHHRRGRRGNLGRVAAEVLKRKLDIDEDQEGIVDHATQDLKEALASLRATLADSRGDLADAFRGETVDDAALAATFALHDDELARARRQVVSALKQIHAVLDDDQRATAADWLATAKGWR